VSVSLSTLLGMRIRKLLETYDTTSTAMEKTALKIRHLVEAMDEEEISYHEHVAQNLVIETGGLEDIESAKRNYNDIPHYVRTCVDGVHRGFDNGPKKRCRSVL
jgi:hypothetical protein